MEWPRRCTCTKICVVNGVGGCREGSGGWMGTRQTSVDAFGCWTEDGGGLECSGLVCAKQ